MTGAAPHAAAIARPVGAWRALRCRFRAAARRRARADAAAVLAGLAGRRRRLARSSPRRRRARWRCIVLIGCCRRARTASAGFWLALAALWLGRLARGWLASMRSPRSRPDAASAASADLAVAAALRRSPAVPLGGRGASASACRRCCCRRPRRSARRFVSVAADPAARISSRPSSSRVLAG